MKFCPFCGVSTVAGDKFCQSCGALLADEGKPLNGPAGQSQDPTIPDVLKPGCIHCGVLLEADDKFCPECGNRVDLIMPPPLNDTADNLSIQEVSSISLCKLCGAELIEGDRFCAECGAETLVNNIATPEPIMQPPVEPQPIFEPSPGRQTPLMTETLKTALKPSEPISQTKIEPQSNIRKKNKLLIILFISLVVLAALVNIWFFVFDKEVSETKVDSITDIAPGQAVVVPETPSIDSAGVRKAQEEINKGGQDDFNPELTKTEKAKPLTSNKEEKASPNTSKKGRSTKPKKDINKPTTLTNKGEPKSTKPGFEADNKSIKKPGVIYSNWNDKPVKNNPWSKTRFELKNNMVISRIKTLHYNKGAGDASVGSISIVGNKRVTYGPWPCTTQNAEDGTPSAIWVCTPNVTVPAGKYKIINTGMKTWSWNADSGKKGFIIIEGYQN